MHDARKNAHAEESQHQPVPPFGSFAARHPQLVVALVSFAAAAALLAPALGTKNFLYGTDTVAHDYVLLLYGWRRILSEGRIPLWCSHLFCGLPLLGSFAFCPFYPTQALFALLPFNTAFTLQYLLALAVGGWGCALWARTLGRGLRGMLFAAVAFQLSGHFLTLVHAGHLQKVMAIAWAPVALACVTKLQRATVPQAALGFSVAVAMQLLASHSQIAYATLLISTLWLLFSTVFAARASLAEAIRRVLWFVGALGIGVGLSAVQVIPGLEMAGQSNRAGGVDFTEATATSYPPREILEYGFSRIFGDTIHGTPTPYFGEWGERIVSDFVGLPLLLLVAIGLLISSRRERWPLALLCAGSLLVGVGHYTPVYRLLYDHLPGFSKFRSPGTYMFVADMALVQLAALGVETLRKEVSVGRDGEHERIPWLRTRWVAALGVFAGVFVLLAAQHVARLVVPESTPVHVSLAAERLRLGAVEGTLAALLLGLATLRLQHLPRWMPSSALNLLALTALLVPWAHNRYFIRFESLPPYMEYLQRQPHYAAAKRLAQQQPVRLLQENALKNDGVLHDVGVPTGYHPVIPARYAAVLESLGYDSAAFCRLFAVNFAALDASRSPRESAAWRACATVPPYKIWELREPGHYLTVTTSPVFIAGRSRALVRLKERRGSEVIVEERGSDLNSRAWRSQAQAAPPTARLIGFSAGRIEFDVFTSVPTVVGLAESFVSGWQATDQTGRRYPVFPVNVAQCGILADRSARITLEYAPFSYRIGAFGTLTSLAILVFGVFALLLRRGLGGRRS